MIHAQPFLLLGNVVGIGPLAEEMSVFEIPFA